MQINVTCRHMEPNEDLREYAAGKVEQLFDDFPRTQTAHVILDVEKYRHIAEVVIHGKNHIHIEAKHESDDMYASIDEAVGKAERQLRKLRDKVQDHKGNAKPSEIDLAASEQDTEQNEF